MPTHDMLPDTDHDEQAMQDFVTSLRGHLASKVMPGNFAVYANRVEPRFEQAHKRKPNSRHEVRKLMVRDNYYQFWSAMQRRSQEMMWDSVIAPTERQWETLIDRARERAADCAVGGSLSLNPDLEVPRYHTAADIHIQPGGYHSEFRADDVAAGALYEGGLPIYLGGAMGERNDLLGRVSTHFMQSEFPDARPARILDMGCAVGNSTLPWHECYPDAEIHAIDVAAPCLRFGHARAEYFGAPIHFSQQNAESTNFEDDSFDVVLSHIMLHETSHRAIRNVMAESYRVLRPGGVMLHLEIPRGNDPFEQFMFDWETYNNNETFAGYMTGLDLAKIAREAGFEDGKARIADAPTPMNQQQSMYATSAFVWPILVGIK